MMRFTYKAKEVKTGKVVTGTIQAESERNAGKLLIERGYTPEKITEEKIGGLGGRKKPTSKERVNFTRQFATLIGAGLPLSQALKTVTAQTPNGPMKKILEEISVDIEAGRSLSDSMSKHPEAFNNLYLSLIRAGEVSGTLDNSLKRLADQEEKNEKIMSKIRGAMTYPMIALVVVMFVFVYMMLNVVPEVKSLYENQGKKLPLLTQILVWLMNFIINDWYLAIGAIAIIVFFIVQFFKTDQGKKLIDTVTLNMPMFNSLFSLLYNGRVARITEILLATGVPVIESLTIAAEASSNSIVEAEVMDAVDGIKTGKPLSVCLTDKKYIRPLTAQMAAIGEQSGAMDEMLGKAASTYEDELDEKVNAISTLIEPLMLVMLGGMAAIILAGTLLPIYSLVNEIS